MRNERSGDCTNLAKVSEGVTILEGEKAKEKWISMRNNWLVAHGYDKPETDDWNLTNPEVVAPKQHDAK
jgi:hypothetical protein